jgi:hypothetical protein
MRTHLYKIQRLDGETSLKDLLTKLKKRELLDRNRNINGFENRIEDIKFVTNDGVACALINFVKLRMTHGPGRGSLAENTRGFDLEGHEGFAEETAALLDLEHNHAVIEYNHHGARYAALEDYLSRINPDLGNRFELLPCLDDEAMRRLQRMQTLNKIEIKVAPGKLTSKEKHGIPLLNKALDIAEVADAPALTLTLGGLPGVRARLNDALWPVLNALVDRVRHDDTLGHERERAIKTLKVTGKEAENLGAELLDLVKGRVYREHELTPGPDRRFSLDDRWSALCRDHIHWRRAIR